MAYIPKICQNIESIRDEWSSALLNEDGRAPIGSLINIIFYCLPTTIDNFKKSEKIVSDKYLSSQAKEHLLSKLDEAEARRLFYSGQLVEWAQLDQNQLENIDPPIWESLPQIDRNNITTYVVNPMIYGKYPKSWNAISNGLPSAPPEINEQEYIQSLYSINTLPLDDIKPPVVSKPKNYFWPFLIGGGFVTYLLTNIGRNKKEEYL